MTSYLVCLLFKQGRLSHLNLSFGVDAAGQGPNSPRAVGERLGLLFVYIRRRLRKELILLLMVVAAGKTGGMRHIAPEGAN